MNKKITRIIASILTCMTLFSVVTCYTQITREELIVGNNYETELKGLTLNKFYSHKKETQAIIDKHKYDFDSTDVKVVLKREGGYVNYVKKLGGVFEKYINNGKPVKITTYTQLAEVADYVWGLYDIWGVDYSNGCGYEAKHQYNYDNGGASRFYPNIEPKKRFKVNYSCREDDWANKGDMPGVDEMLANPDKYYAVVNCDMGVCQLFKKAGLIPQNMPGPGTYPRTYKSKGYGYTIIRNPKDFMPGDVILVMDSNNVNVSGIKDVPDWQDHLFHTIVVGERDDKAGTITYYDSGHKYTRKGTYRSIRALGDNKVYTTHSKWIALRYNFTKNLKDDRYDKTPPKLTVSYNKTKLTNTGVIAKISANEQLKAVKGWTLSNDKLSLSKTYESNTTEKVTVSDLSDNKSTVTIKISNIDKTAPKLSVEYSNKELTNKNVLVTIKSNEKIKTIDGWAISSNQLSISKSYSKNTKESITIYDIAGNKSKVNIEIKNIDKEAPKLDISYSTTELTNKGVTVTIKSNEKIKDIPSDWVLNNDGTTMTKEYDKNVKEKFEISDMLGNKATVEFEIKNIYETKLESDKYKVEKDVIIITETGTTVSEFKDNNKMTAKKIRIINKFGVELSANSLLGTGNKIIIDDSIEYTIIVMGDYDGDGITSVKDMALSQRAVLQTVELDDVQLRALDFNENGRIDVSDLARVCRIVKGQ